MIKNLSVPTAVAVVAGIVGMCVLAWLKVDEAIVVGYAGAFITVAGAMKALFESKGGSDDAK